MAGDAESMAASQRSISVSEFFAKNRHLLGFDNKRKALLTTVKEAVDNSLDACEEAGIPPEIHVSLTQVGDDRWRVSVRDNGPGILREQLPQVFGKLLYGSKFHRLKMSRGQQGIGISAAGMYGLITTGKPVRVVSRTGPDDPGCEMTLAINTNRNLPEVMSDSPASVRWERGTEVEIEMEATYAKGRLSVDEYVELTAIANPHAEIHYRPPSGPVTFSRAVDAMPADTREIKPHPHGVELGTMMRMLRETKSETVSAFLRGEFCRVSEAIASRVCRNAKVCASRAARSVKPDDAERLHSALQDAKIMSPPTDCLSPIGAEALLAGLLKGIKAEFYTAVVRPPTVYNGNPFQIEVALAWGGDIAKDEGDKAKLIRFANRVPLLHQPGSCCMHKAVTDVRWGGYGLSQTKGSLPSAPLVVLAHMASVWVPYMSEGKEAVADYDEIRKEIKLALAECGRRLARLVRRRKRRKRHQDRRDTFDRYIGEVADAVCSILPDTDNSRLLSNLRAIAKTHTQRADEQYDDHGKVIRSDDIPDTIIIDS